MTQVKKVLTTVTKLSLLSTLAYVDGDVTVAAKGTDQDEMEVSVSFAF